MMYIPLHENEETLIHNVSTWEATYVAFETIVHINEARSTYNVNPTWGDLEVALNDLENPRDHDETFRNPKTTITSSESCDLQADFPRPPAAETEKRINLGFQVTKHPFLIENNEYHRIRRLLNREQQTIVKDIALKKWLNMNNRVHVFLTGRAGTCKTFTAKALFQMLIRIYDSKNFFDPMKPKGLIVAYTGKAAYNVGGTTVHSAFLMPFNKSQFLLLSKEMLDTLSKIYEELQLVFIDEASLIGNRFLYFIDNQLRIIKHVQTKYFGNIDMIFCGNLYQAQPIQDGLIFEQPIGNMETMTREFWRDNIKFFELHTTMRQIDETFIAILNRMHTNNQPYDDLTCINLRCLRPTTTNPTFPYLFYRNKDVAKHNSHMLSLMPGDDIIINSIDLEEDNHGNVPRHEHLVTLPSHLALKLKMLVETYACNYDSRDGLVNGVDGILKGYMRT
jgi:hypothetical protein